MKIDINNNLKQKLYFIVFCQ